MTHILLITLIKNVIQNISGLKYQNKDWFKTLKQKMNYVNQCYNLSTANTPLCFGHERPATPLQGPIPN